MKTMSSLGFYRAPLPVSVSRAPKIHRPSIASTGPSRRLNVVAADGPGASLAAAVRKPINGAINGLGKLIRQAQHMGRPVFLPVAIEHAGGKIKLPKEAMLFLKAKPGDRAWVSLRGEVLCVDFSPTKTFSSQVTSVRRAQLGIDRTMEMPELIAFEARQRAESVGTKCKVAGESVDVVNRWTMIIGVERDGFMLGRRAAFAFETPNFDAIDE